MGDPVFCWVFFNSWTGGRSRYQSKECWEAKIQSDLVTQESLSIILSILSFPKESFTLITTVKFKKKYWTLQQKQTQTSRKLLCTLFKVIKAKVKSSVTLWESDQCSLGCWEWWDENYPTLFTKVFLNLVSSSSRERIFSGTLNYIAEKRSMYPIICKNLPWMIISRL